MVMANPYMSDVPPWAFALLMAGCIAAALSTAAGLLLVLSTSISHDLLKKILKPELTDKEEVSWARIASFVSLAVAAYFGATEFVSVALTALAMHAPDCLSDQPLFDFGFYFHAR